MPEKTTLTSEEFLRLAEVRSQIYSFLSSIYIQIPSLDFVKKLLDKESSSFLSTIPLDDGLPQEMLEGLEDIQKFISTSKGKTVEEVQQSLNVDRTRLFRGLMADYSPPPPYESVYREETQLLMGKSTIAVREIYAKAGVGVPDDYKEPPDYIGIELDFMRFLAQKEAKSWKNKKRANALGYLKKEGDFLEGHIAKWVPRFCDKVIDMATLDFYRGIAKMTKGFITDDREKIEGFINSLKK